MRRLWVQLTLAFTLVALVAVGVIALLIGRTTDSEFRRYITNSEMRASGSGLAILVEYFHQNGSWEGVEILLAEGISLGGPFGAPGMPRLDRHADIPRPRLDVMLADATGLSSILWKFDAHFSSVYLFKSSRICSAGMLSVCL